jgi:hypothetical protein
MRTRLANRRHRRIVALAAMGVVGLQTVQASATTYTDSWTGATNTSFYTTTNWSTSNPMGEPVPVASGNGNDIVSVSTSATNVALVVNYDQGANANYTFNALDLAATWTGSSSTFNINSAGSGSNYVIRSGGNNSLIGQSSTVNINNSSTLAVYQNFYIGSNKDTAATPAEVEINSGSFSFSGTNSEFADGYNSSYAQIDVGSTANSTAGTLTVAAYEMLSNGGVASGNFGIGLRVGDGAGGTGELNLNAGSVNLGTTTNPSALLVGYRSVSNSATTGNAIGTVNQSAGVWNNTGDVLVGYDAAITTAPAAFGSAQGTLNISAGNFNMLSSSSTTRQIVVGASNGVGTLNLSGSGVLGSSALPVTTITTGGTFDYLNNFNPAYTGNVYTDGYTDSSYQGAKGYIAGAGTFNQSGGTAYITTLNLGSTPGTNSSTGSSVQGTGTFNMTNGTANIATINVAANSLLSISGGTANVTNINLAPPGGTGGAENAAFSFTGGTLTGLSGLTFNDGSTLTLANGMSLTSVTVTENGTTNTLQWAGPLPSYDGLQPTDKVLLISSQNSIGGSAQFVLGSSFAAANTATPGMYAIDYSTPDDVYLDVTPEPASLGAIALSGLMMLRRRRRS